MSGFSLSVARIENIIPILHVANMEASFRFYVGGLGFDSTPWSNADFACVRRDGASLYLTTGEQGKGGAWVWVGVDDADKLQVEFKARGVAIRQPPTNYPWAYEMHVEDPDGNVLRFGSAPKEAPST